jgi:hypothetical protein
MRETGRRRRNCVDFLIQDLKSEKLFEIAASEKSGIQLLKCQIAPVRLRITFGPGWP